MSTALHNSGRFAESEALREEWLAFCGDQGDRLGEIWAMLALVPTKRHLGAYREAQTLAHRALVLCHETERQLDIARGWLGLGRAALAEGAYDTAEEWLGQCLVAFEHVGGSSYFGETQSALAYLGRELGQPDGARGRLREALRVAPGSRHRNVVCRRCPRWRCC